MNRARWPCAVRSGCKAESSNRRARTGDAMGLGEDVGQPLDVFGDEAEGR